MDIVYEAGEAIGNAGRRLFRGKRVRQAEEVLAHWSQQVSTPHIPAKRGERIPAQEEAIDVEYRILDQDPLEDTQEGEAR